MKVRKRIGMVLAALLFILAACFVILAVRQAAASDRTEDALLVRALDRLYVSTGEDVTQAVEQDIAESYIDSPFIGTIESAVDSGQVPLEDRQANFDAAGAEIVFHREGVAVDLGEEWIYFAPHPLQEPESRIGELAGSIACADGSVSFTIPEGEGEWNILINGRTETADGNGMSVHYLEGERWEPGRTYSFETAGSYTDLTMDVQLEGAERTVDLLPLLPNGQAAE